MKTTHQYYVYLLASKIRGTLYIGVTNNLERRVYEHKMGIKKGFTQKYRVNRLVYFEVFQNIEAASDREKKVKKWKCDWKIKLIEEENVRWLDLSKDWYDNLLQD